MTSFITIWEFDPQYDLYLYAALSKKLHAYIRSENKFTLMYLI